MEISLRELQGSDLPVFWEQLTDPELQQMAAMTTKYHYTVTTSTSTGPGFGPIRWRCCALLSPTDP
ncbi:hypothetical protein [Streptomyces sp. NPDC060002]|uniref:hypothetical protein n=1 Tax=Streptomyces sp. NPDC060002 TaxID=3347033 RepID=UPI0036CC6CD3